MQEGFRANLARSSVGQVSLLLRLPDRASAGARSPKQVYPGRRVVEFARIERIGMKSIGYFFVGLGCILSIPFIAVAYPFYLLYKLGKNVCGVK